DLGDRALEEFEALAEPQLEARTLKLLTGKQALELLPAVDWHKGRAAECIRARVAPRVARPGARVREVVQRPRRRAVRHGARAPPRTAPHRRAARGSAIGWTVFCAAR